MQDLEDLLALGRALGDDPTAMAAAAERWLRVRDRGGAIRPLRANAVQRAFEQVHTGRSIVLKARQVGLTTWIAARFFLKTMTMPGTMTVQVAHTRDAAEGIFRIVQRMWEHLPEELRTGPLRRGRANVGHISFPELDSEYRIVSAGDPGAGRGLSIQNLHLSEVAQWTGDATETLAGLRAALAPTGEMVMESTPRGAYGCFYEEWQRAETSGTVRHFFPWWMEEAYVSASVADEAMSDEERALVALHGLTPQQIGFRRTLESGFHRLRAQEYAEDAASCFLSSGECCFDTEAVLRRMRSLPAVVERRGGLLRWLPPVTGREYIVGVDTAGGGAAGDFCAVQVIERASGLQCAELQQHLAPRQLAQETAALARAYNEAVIAVERNNHGAAVLAYLESTERYPRLYASGGVAGWPTNVSTKPVMMERMIELVATQPGIFYSPRLLDEMRTCITQPNGGTGAAAGAHDDCLMAMAVAQAVRAEMLGRR